METFRLNLFLIGFMGTGKSTVARLLEENYGMEMLEMDETISGREGMSIPEIFAGKGEAYFRERETELLKELEDRSGVAVSCGGGVPLRECNVKAMRRTGRVVWLKALPETIFSRVKDDHSRPLLENKKDPAQIAEMMEKRRPKYEAAADITVSTDGKTAEEICQEIIEKLKEMDGERCSINFSRMTM